MLTILIPVTAAIGVQNADSPATRVAVAAAIPAVAWLAIAAAHAATRNVTHR